MKYRLGRSIARMEAAMSTPEMFGRVANAQTMRDVTPDLMDILGTAARLPVDTDGAADDGGAEYLFRLASPMGIYGGTLEVFRNMIAQHALGPRATELLAHCRAPGLTRGGDRCRAFLPALVG